VTYYTVFVIDLASRRVQIVAHYHRERNHQGIDNERIAGAAVLEGQHGRIRRRPRLGGLLNFYERAA
jgi:hypothetical protein